MSLLNDKDRQFVVEKFSTINMPVKLIVFTQSFECQFCRETRQIAEEVASLSEMVELEIYDFVDDQEIAEQYKLDKVPAMVVMRGGEQPKDFGIRYYGVPSGYEFSSLLDDIVMVGVGNSQLSEQTRSWLASLESPLHFQVFVTPTCPYCPQAVHLAHRLALESDWVTADMVEATEFPHLSNKYNVMGVPRTVVNEDTHIEGAAPEAMLLARLQEISS